MRGEKTKRDLTLLQRDERLIKQPLKSRLPRLIYIREGKEKVGRGRFKLKRPYYLGGLYSDTDELWLDVFTLKSIMSYIVLSEFIFVETGVNG